jgi:hypothetical protein
VQFVWPIQQPAPQPTIVQQVAEKVQTPVETQVSVVQEPVLQKPVVTQRIEQPATVAKVEADLADESVEGAKPRRSKPSCDGSEWADQSEPIAVKVGMKVCNETGRLIASVKSISTKGYFGGSISFVAPGKDKPLKCFKDKTCQFPWARGFTYVIESFEDDFGDPVAMLVQQ